jgi:cytochrome c heme-lyase
MSENKNSQACPVNHKSSTNEFPLSNSPETKGCPVDHGKFKVNPHNMMPLESQEMAPNQASKLSTERATSSIKDKDSQYWQYPSPQQFYNSL